MAILLLAEQLRRAKPLTFPQFIGDLYQNKVIRVIAGIVYVVVCMAYLVPQFKAASMVAQHLTGLPYIWGVLIIAGLVTVIYVTNGGFWRLP